MFYYLLAASALLLILIVYANRRQARVTALVDVHEPDVDLTYKPQVTAPRAVPAAELQTKRDPSLARLSTEELVMEVLRECQDPEIPLNIVDLGLVYDVQAAQDAVRVKMSMTAPDCPSHHSITQDVRAKLEEAGFADPQVEVVWDPPWTPHRISEEGRKKLGM